MAEFQSTVEYRLIPGFPGYRVGNDGSVWSCRKKHRGGWYLLKPIVNWTGHLRVELFAGGVSRTRLVHHLVLEAFIGPRPEGKECCHNDGEPTNNRVENLRWDTKASNILDRTLHGRTARGSRVSQSRLTEAHVREIILAARTGVGFRALARRYGVRHAAIADIVHRRTWRHVSPEIGL